MSKSRNFTRKKSAVANKATAGKTDKGSHTLKQKKQQPAASTKSVEKDQQASLPSTAKKSRLLSKKSWNLKEAKSAELDKPQSRTSSVDETNRAGTATPPVSRGATTLVVPLTMNITFLLGIGQITIKQFRNRALIDTKRVTQSADVRFEDAAAGDTLSLTGACSGKMEIFTDRNTEPAAQQNSPLKYEQVIEDILVIQ